MTYLTNNRRLAVRGYRAEPQAIVENLPHVWYVSPPGIVGIADLREPDSQGQYATGRYGAYVHFARTPDSPLAEAGATVWTAEEEERLLDALTQIGELAWPHLRGDLSSVILPIREDDRIDSVYLRPRTRREPEYVGPSKERLPTAQAPQTGDLVRFIATPWPSDTRDGKTLSLRLWKVQLIRRGAFRMTAGTSGMPDLPSAHSVRQDGPPDFDDIPTAPVRPIRPQLVRRDHSAPHVQSAPKSPAPLIQRATVERAGGAARYREVSRETSPFRRQAAQPVRQDQETHTAQSAQSAQPAQEVQPAQEAPVAPVAQAPIQEDGIDF